MFMSADNLELMSLDSQVLKQVRSLARRVLISNIKTVPQEDDDNVNRDAVMARVHRLCSACLWGIITEGGDADAAAVTQLCTAPGLHWHIVIHLTVSISLRKGRVMGGGFTCEPFPFVI